MEPLIILLIESIVYIPLEFVLDKYGFWNKGKIDKPISTIIRLLVFIICSAIVYHPVNEFLAFFWGVIFMGSVFFALFDFTVNILRWKSLPKDHKNRKLNTFIIRLFYHGNGSGSIYDKFFLRIPPQMELLLKGLAVYISIHYLRRNEK